jgi:hypothetical protein
VEDRVMGAPISLQLSAPWLWTAGAFLAAGILVATTRKALGNFSRKLLLDRLPFGQKERFERYFDRLAAKAAGVDPPPEASGPIPEVITVGPPIGDAR